MTHDSIRHGTTTLFASLNLLGGMVLDRCMQRYRYQEFIRYLNAVEAAVAASKQVHAILDNHAVHYPKGMRIIKHFMVLAWLARNPRWTFRSTPTSCSWLNAVEDVAATLTKRRLRRGTFASLVALQAAIKRYLAEANENFRPFVWTAGPDGIILKVRREHRAPWSVTRVSSQHKHTVVAALGALISIALGLSVLVVFAGRAEAKWPPQSEAISPVPPPALPTAITVGTNVDDVVPLSATASTDEHLSADASAMQSVPYASSPLRRVAEILDASDWPAEGDASVGAVTASVGAAADGEPSHGVISRNEPTAKTTGETQLVSEWIINSIDAEEDDEDEEPTINFGKLAGKLRIVAERNRRGGENGGYRLSLTSVLPDGRERPSIGQSRTGQLPEGLFALDTSMAIGSAASIQMKTSNRRWDGFVKDNPFRLWLDDGWDWERNGVSDSHVVIGLAEDRLRFTTRYSRSRYTASSTYLRRLAEKNGRDDEDSPARFDGRKGVEGDALLNRLDVDVMRSNVFRLSLFGQHREVDPYYEDIALRDSKDDFSKSNEEEDRWGGTVGLGPVALTLAQYRSRKVEILDDEEDADKTSRLPRTVGDEAQITIDLSDARRRLPDMFGKTTWSVLPQSVWFGVGRGAVDTGLDDEPQDRTEDWDAGMSWNWDSGYGSISAWQSTYKMQQDWAKGGGYKGTGVDVSLGLWQDTWGVDGNLSVGRYEYNDSYYQSGDTDLGGGVSIWAKFETFPDLSADLYLSHFRSEYDSSGRGVSLGRFSTLSVIADISKYLTDIPEEKRPSLHLFYRVDYDQSANNYEGDSSNSGALDHIFGIKFQMNF